MTYGELEDRMSQKELYRWLAHDGLEAADRKQAQATANAKSRLR